MNSIKIHKVIDHSRIWYQDKKLKRNTRTLNRRTVKTNIVCTITLVS